MSTPVLPGIFGAMEPVLNNYGYLAVAALVMLEDFGIPVPGETVVIAAALYAGAGRLNVVLVGVIATLAAIVGDNIGFAIGHFGGRALALRWGKYVFLTAERLDKAEYFFDHHGGKIIVIARFIEGLRQANGIVAGITGMHWKRFVFFNAIGAALWVGVWVSLGYLAGNYITTIYTQITRYSLYVLIVLGVAIVAFIAWRLWRRRGRQAGRAQATETAGAAGTEAVNETAGAAGTEAVNETAGAAEAEAVNGTPTGTAEPPTAAEPAGVAGAEEVSETAGAAGTEAVNGTPIGAAEPPTAAEPPDGLPPVSPDGTARRSHAAAEPPDEGDNGTPR